MEEIVDYTFFFDVREKKGSGHSVSAVRPMTHQFDVLACQKGADLSRSVRARIAVVSNDLSSLLHSSNFCEEIVVYHSELTVEWRSRHMTSNAEETGDHLLRSDFFHKQLSLDLARVRRHDELIFCFEHTHMSYA